MHQCRICLADDEATELIAPCHCRGTSMFVHRPCLDEWRATKADAFDECQVCRFRYIFDVVDDDGAERTRVWRFRALVARDTVILFMTVQIVVATLGYIVHKIDVNEYIPSHLPSWLAENPKTTYYICGVVALIVLTGLFFSLYLCLSGGCNCNAHGSFCYFGDCRCDGEGGAAVLAFIALVVIVVFAVIGVFVLFVAGTVAFQRIVQRHVRVVWLRQETKRKPVKDLLGASAPGGRGIAGGYTQMV